MNYAVMPLADYDAACDKVREKVDLTTPTIKSGELAEKVDEVYMAGASDFGLKGKGQGELVTLNNVHPIEHKVEVGLRSKNLFNEAEANITKTEDYFKSNVSYWQSPCLTIPVESGATYTCSCEYYTPNVTTFNTYLAYSINTEKTYTSAAKALAMRLKTQSSTEGYSKVSNTFTVPDGIEEVYFLADNEGKGTYFKNFQIEKGTTPTAYAPFVADFSDCKVKVSGKNLVDITNPYSKGDTSKWEIVNGDTLRNYVKSGFGGAPSYRIELPPNTKCMLTFDYELGGDAADGGTWNTASGTSYPASIVIKSPQILTTGAGGWVTFSFLRSGGSGNNKLGWIDVKNLQVEIGEIATDYEPYTETEYTAAADGTVEGVKSISPTMNLSTDKAGAVIDAECFLDPQAVITDLTNTVITLGGEV